MYPYQEYLDLKKTDKTREAVSGSLKYFLLLQYDTAGEDLQAASIEYLQDSEQNHFDNVKAFIKWLSDCGKSPNTIYSRYTSVMTWLKWNDISFTPAQQSMLQSLLPRKVTVHDEADLTRDKIKSLLAHADPLMRAVILCLVSSGMRVGELLSVDFSQLRDNEFHMNYMQMKAGKPHVYFISAEALAALREWLKVREKFLSGSRHKSAACLGRGVRLEFDNRIFPLTAATLFQKFQHVQKSAGLYEYDPQAKRARLTFHMFRKFADSTMNLHISKNETNALIGHFEPGDSAYRRYTREQLREAYKKVEPYLTMQAPADYAESKDEVRASLATHDKILVALYEEKIEMQKRMERLERLLRVAEHLD